jgi:hypothetical protein
MQMQPDTFAQYGGKRIFDLNDNMRAAASYLSDLSKKYNGDWVKAAGAYNWGPGNMDEFLAGHKPLPTETARYMAYVSAQLQADHEYPLPPDLDKGRVLTNPSPGQVADRTNTDPMKAHYNWAEEFAGHENGAFIMANAKAMDDMLHTGNLHQRTAWEEYKKNPAAADSYYGINSAPVLKAFAEHGNPEQRAEAKLYQKYPGLASFGAMVESFFNPQAVVEGMAAGSMLGAAGRSLLGAAVETKSGQRVLMGGYDWARKALHWTSPYKGIVGKFGTNARNMVVGMGGAMKAGAQEAAELTEKIFGGHTIEEQMDIVHHYQGSGARLGERADLKAKGAMLEQIIPKLTAEQVAAGVLRPSEVFKGKFFPMGGGNYINDFYDTETKGVLEQLRFRKGDVPFQDPADPRRQKIFKTLEAARNGNPETGARLDEENFSAAEQFERWYRSRKGNIAFDKGLQDLAKRYPSLIRLTGFQKTGREVDQWGRKMYRASELFGHVDSPTLMKAWLAPELKEFLERPSSPGVLSGRAHYMDGAFESNFDKFARSFNGTMRSMIMYNPVFHPLWNIANNAAALGRSAEGAFMNQAKAVVGMAFEIPEFLKAVGLPAWAKMSREARQVVEDKFMGGSQQYAQDVLDAARSGASSGIHTNLTGSNTALAGEGSRVRILPWSELKPMERADKFFTRMGDFNRDATFGKYGEEQFSTYLFKKFTDPKGSYRMLPEDAGWAIREALGNYANVSPDSWQSKYLFFYPWLKSNLPFWLRAFATNPRYVAAPTTGYARERQLTGDPRAYDTQYARNPNQAYLGRDKQTGEDIHWTAPYPDKDANRFMDVIDPRGSTQGGPNFSARMEAAAELISGRMVPGVSWLYNVVSTMHGPAATPGTYQGFTTMWDKDAAPDNEQFKQLANSSIAQFFPVPAPFLTHDVIKDGFRADRVAEYAAMFSGLGSISRTDGAAVQRTHKRDRQLLTHAMIKLDKAEKSGRLVGDALENARKKAYDKYLDASKKHLQVLQKKTGINLTTNDPLAPVGAVGGDPLAH